MNWIEIIPIFLTFVSFFFGGFHWYNQWHKNAVEAKNNRERDFNHLLRNHAQTVQNIKELTDEIDDLKLAIAEIKNLLTAACIIRPKE